MNKSNGHFLFLGKYEFFIRSGDLYQAVSANPIMPDGSRSGRWACPIRMAYDHLKTIIDTFDLTVDLCAYGNPDIMVAMRQSSVETLEDAAKVVLEYISEYDIDESQFPCGHVWAHYKKSEPKIIQRVAHVSYSGRIWIGDLMAEDDND